MIRCAILDNNTLLELKVEPGAKVPSETRSLVTLRNGCDDPILSFRGVSTYLAPVNGDEA
jgi:hypothetical protein